MPAISDDALVAVRQNIEALALEVALRDFTSLEGIETLVSMLLQLREEAEAAGMDALADIAAAVSRQIANAPDLPTLEQLLRDTVAGMQQLAAGPGCAIEALPAPPPPLNQDLELVGDFIMESREHLSRLEAQVLALEQNPQDLEAVNTIFRGFHSIKGLAGFLDFPAIERFAHELETLLDLARNQKAPVNSALIDIILQSADHMNHCLRGVETGLAPASDGGPLLSLIRKMIDDAADAPSRSSEILTLSHDGEEEILKSTSAGDREATGGPRSVKVDTAKLDFLVDMVGELVIAQSLVRHDPGMATLQSARLNRNLTQLTRITADVQKVAMAMRMLPIAQLFGRMARLVRDLSRKTGKQVHLELAGEDTELDRNMIEEVADPLMHMIRNAVDHGSESPEDRVAAGKNATSRVDLKASHQGGFIHIEISDDGRGLVREKILAKARERGLVSGGDDLTDQQIFSFIFEPGFSTAEAVTGVSGRGVGMDVVRKQIMKLRGLIDISSRPGQGATFVINLPLTLAIIEGLVVGVGQHRYIVPIFAVKEMFRPTPEALSSVPHGGEMVLVRGSLLPILRLHRRFGITPRSPEPSACILIVVETATRNFCLMVDDVIGKQEVVIKSLGPTFQAVTGVSGGCILGDGRVGLILDVEALLGKRSRD